MFFLIVISLWSCNYDTIVPEQPDCAELITYEGHTREIIGVTCASSGCHDGTVSVPGNFTSYDKMKGNFKPGARSIETQIRSGFMPPFGEPELTPEERETLLCWIEANYPEK